MRVLFSNVGKSDPMTIFENCEVYDGSFLHIIRNYEPQIVYLYMSKEICEFDELDNRYELAIQLYNEENNTNVKVIKLKRKQLVNVHRFDEFYEEFENIIEDIVNENGEDVEILCNVSSGTPAMKSALQIISSLSKYKLNPIQVDDPTEGKYKRDVDLNEYDSNIYWEQNIDNISPLNRTYCSKNASFQFKIQKEMVIQLINSYDYEAAYKIINNYKHRINDTKFFDLLKMAVDRYNLDSQSIIKIENKNHFQLLPYYNKEQMKIFEYALWMDIKIRKGEIVEFIRGLNPFMYEACQKILLDNLKININSYCDRIYLKRDMLEKDDQGKGLLNILDASFNNGYKDSFLSETQMLPIIYKKVQSDKVVESLKLLNSLREEKRNIVSHQIICVKEQHIIDELNHKMKDYIIAIKIILNFMGYDVSNNWDSYMKMNKYIIDKVKDLR